MANYGVYVTMAELKAELSRDDIKDDNLLKSKCFNASRLFDLACHRHFFPVYETRYYDHPGDYVSAFTAINNSRLLLDEDLLAVDTLTTDNGGTTIASADYILRRGKSSNFPPFNNIELKTNGTTTIFSYSGTPQESNAVTGWWGYHEDWGNAWLDSGDTVQDDPLSDSATTVTVDNARNFEPQQLIRLGTEYAYIESINTTAETLTVKRGVNGTTAASHLQDTTIYIYQVQSDISEIVKQWAVFLTRLKNSPYGVGGVAELGQTEISSLKRSDLYGMAKAYKRRYKRR